jgi:uncharacterized protein (TIGR02646 family)
MSQADNPSPFLFQSLKGKIINFSDDEKMIVAGLLPLEGGEWEDEFKDESTGKILVKAGCSILKSQREKLVKDIKAKLLEIQGSYCIYCGMHSDYCGNLQREHIAPKGKRHYPAFVFEPQNLCLACNTCNCELKREKDFASGEKEDYSKNSFAIIHPYLDDFFEHIEFAVEKGRCLIKTKNKSQKGAQTITIFQLAGVARTMQRSGFLTMEDNQPSIEKDERLSKIFFNKYLPKQRA